MALLIIPALKKWSRARGPYGYLRTWDWPITAREITQPYNNNMAFQAEILNSKYLIKEHSASAQNLDILI